MGQNKQTLAYITSLILFFSFNVFGQVNNIEGKYGINTEMPTNYVRNKSCISNASYITGTGTTTQNTTPPVLSGKADCAIDDASSGLTHKWQTFTFDKKLDYGNCEAKFTYKGDASLYKAYINVGGNKVTSDLQLTNATNPQIASINFPCGLYSDAKEVVIESTSASAAAIKVVDVYAGLVTNLGFADVNTDWYEYTPTFTGFGTVSTSYLRWRRVGDSVEIQGAFNSGTPTATAASFTLPNSFTANVLIGGGQDQDIGTWTDNNGSATTAKKGHLLIANGTSVVYFAFNDYTPAISGQTHQNGNAFAVNTQLIWINAKVKVNGLSSEIYLKPSVSNWRVDANISGNNVNLGSSAQTSYVEITDSSLTLTNNTGNNVLTASIPCSSTNPSTGTTCSAGNESVGISFVLPKAGAALACASFSHIINVTTGNAQVVFQIVETGNSNQTINEEGKSRISSELNKAAGNDQVQHPLRVCGTFNFSSAGQKTLRLMYEQSTSGTVNSNAVLADAAGAAGQRDIHWEVYPIDQQMQMPILVDSVQRSTTVKNNISTGITTVDNGFTSGATCTAVVNIDSCTTAQLNYLRIGNIVSGSFYVAIDPTSAAGIQARIVVPIASGFTSSDQATGSCASASGLGYLRVLSNAANDTLEIEGNAGATTSTVYTCSYSYQVL